MSHSRPTLLPIVATLTIIFILAAKPSHALNRPIRLAYRFKPNQVFTTSLRVQSTRAMSVEHVSGLKPDHGETDSVIRGQQRLAKVNSDGSARFSASVQQLVQASTYMGRELPMLKVTYITSSTFADFQYALEKSMIEQAEQMIESRGQISDRLYLGRDVPTEALEQRLALSGQAISLNSRLLSLMRNEPPPVPHLSAPQTVEVQVSADGHIASIAGMPETKVLGFGNPFGELLLGLLLRPVLPETPVSLGESWTGVQKVDVNPGERVLELRCKNTLNDALIKGKQNAVISFEGEGKLTAGPSSEETLTFTVSGDAHIDMSTGVYLNIFEVKLRNTIPHPQPSIAASTTSSTSTVTERSIKALFAQLPPGLLNHVKNPISRTTNAIPKRSSRSAATKPVKR